MRESRRSSPIRDSWIRSGKTRQHLDTGIRTRAGTSLRIGISRKVDEKKRKERVAAEKMGSLGGGGKQCDGLSLA